MGNALPYIHVADREGNKYLTVFDGKRLTVLENVSGKVANGAIEKLQQGAEPIDAFGAGAKMFDCQAMKKLATAEHEDNVALWYTEGEKTKKFTVAMDGYPEQIKLMDLIAAEIPNAQKSEEPIPVWQAIIGPGLTTAAIVAGTAVFATIAADPDPDFNPAGRRAGMKRLLMWLTQTLGVTGIIAIGAVLSLGTLFWLFKRASSPPVKTVIEAA